jgi:CelD/BcsL family acetyltransferase involved in cellulose biosynthesis
MPSLAAPVGTAVLDDRALLVEVVHDAAGLEALRPAWDALHAAVGADAGEAFNPFMSWAWMWHWWQSRAHVSRFAQPRYQLHVVVLRDRAGIVRAIVPFVRARWGVGRLSVRALRLFGFGPTTSDLRSPLVCPTWETAAADLLVELLNPRVGRRHDLTILDGIPETGQLPQRLAGWASVEGWSWGKAVPSHVLPLPETWEAFRGGFKGHLKKSVRHGYNSLQRDGHAWTFEVVDDPAAIPGALDDLFRLHAARAAKDLKPRHVDYYARPADRAALRSVATTMAASGSIALCRLRVNGSVVAARMVFRGRGAVYLHDAGADPAWARYAVATTLTSECLRWAIEHGVTVAHLGTGDDPSKARWQGHQRSLRQLHVVAPTFAGRALAAARRLPRTARDLSMAIVPWWSELPFEVLA